MRTDVDAKSGWRALPRWPDGKLVTAAATVTGPWDSMWPLKVPLPLDVMGDAVVSVLSQHAGRDKDTLSRDGFTQECPVLEQLQDPPPLPNPAVLLTTLTFPPCFHSNEPRSRDLVDFVVKRISALAVPVDWANRTYDLTCDDIVDTAGKVAIKQERATVTGPGIGSYDRWEVHTEQVAHGTIAGLGAVIAVLFSCSPQPSNFRVQEIRAVSRPGGAAAGPAGTGRGRSL
jgi:hypothetical protein